MTVVSDSVTRLTCSFWTMWCLAKGGRERQHTSVQTYTELFVVYTFVEEVHVGLSMEREAGTLLLHCHRAALCCESKRSEKCKSSV